MLALFCSQTQNRLLERVLGKNVWVLNVNKTAAWFGRGRVVTAGKSDQVITDLSVVAKFYSVKVSSMGKTLKSFGGKNELPKMYS